MKNIKTWAAGTALALAAGVTVLTGASAASANTVTPALTACENDVIVTDNFVGANSTDPGTLISLLTHRIDDGFYPAGGGAYNTAQRLRAALQAGCPFV